MADIFVSYDSNDRDWVSGLVDILSSKGWTVWWDRDIPVGETYEKVIVEALNSAQCIVLVWSQRARDSDWVRGEVHEASVQRKTILVVLKDDAALPLALREKQAAKLMDWKGNANHAGCRHSSARWSDTSGRRENSRTTRE